MVFEDCVLTTGGTGDGGDGGVTGGVAGASECDESTIVVRAGEIFHGA